MCSNNTGTLNSVLLILFVNSSLGVDLHQESLRGEKESYYYLIWVVCSTPGFYGNLTWEKYKPSRRRQWHPTPVLLPGKPTDRGTWWAAVHGVTKSQTRLSNFTFNFHFHALEKEMATHSSVLAWRIPGMGEPGGLPSMGSHRVGHNWRDLAAAAAAARGHYSPYQNQ